MSRHEAGWVPDTQPDEYNGKHRTVEEFVATRGLQICGWCEEYHFRAYPAYPDNGCKVGACQCWCMT